MLPPSSSSQVLYNYPPASISRWGLPLYHRNHVPAVYQEPFINTAYRKPDSSFLECLQYNFVGHNDVWNVWSHFIPMWVWLVWLYLLSYRIDLSDPFHYPLLCLWLGGCTYVLFSSMAHMFSCKSFTFRTVGYMVDYLGIAIHFAGSQIASFYYELPPSSFLFHYKRSFLRTALLFNLIAIFSCCISRFFWEKQRYVIRAMACFPSYTLCVISFFLRVQTCVFWGENCVHETLTLHFINIFCCVVLLFFFLSKVPERFIRDKYDIVGQSHTYFHLSSVTVTSIQMYLAPIDAKIQRSGLAAIGIVPDFYSTILPFLIVVLVGLLQVGILAILVVNRVLVSNISQVRTEVKQQDELEGKCYAKEE